MKKVLIALPLVVGAGAAAIAGTSQYAGTQTQAEYQQLLTQLNEVLPFAFVNESYESGLGTSTAVTKVMATTEADAEVLFSLHHDIQHGSVRMDSGGVKVGQVSINTTLHDKESLPAELVDGLIDDELFSLRTNVSYTGVSRHQLNVSGFEKSEDGVDLAWTGVSFDAKTTSGGATVGSGSLGSVNVSDTASGGLLTIGSSPLSVDMQDAGDMLYTGTTTLAFNDVELVSPDMPVPVSLTSFGFDTDTNLKADKLNTSSRFSLAGIDAPLPLKQATLDVEIEGLGVEGFRQYQKLMNTLSADVDTALDDPEFTSKMVTALQSIVQPGSAMSYALNLGNDEGDVDVDLRFGVKNLSDDGMSADAMSKIVTGRDILNILSLTGALDADTEALAQTPLIGMLGVAGDFITVTDDSITSEISLNGDLLNVNGTELPLDAMTGGMLDIPLAELMDL